MKATEARIFSIIALLASVCVWKFLVDDAFRSAFGSEFSFLDNDVIGFSVFGCAVLVPLIGAGFAYYFWRRAERAKWVGLVLLCMNLMLPPLGICDMVYTGMTTSAMLDQR